MSEPNPSELPGAPAPPAPLSAQPRRRLRFSLRTMLFFALLAGSPLIIYANREPWIPGPVLRGHADGLHAASFSPDGEKVLTASRDGTVREWDASTGAELRVYKGHERAVYTANYSPDGTRIVSGGLDRTLVVWAVETGNEVKRIDGHDAHILSAVYSPDGKRIAYGMFDGSARVVDAQTLELVGELKGHTRSVECVTYSPDGKYIATASGDNTVRLWDAETFSEMRQILSTLDIAHCVSFSPSGEWVAVADKAGGITVKSSGLNAARNAEFALLTSNPVPRSRFAPHDHRLLIIADSGKYSQIMAFDGQPDSLDNFEFLDGEFDWPDCSITDGNFSPSGDRIVLASLDQTARIYIRRRPEWWWGYIYLPQTWLAILLLGCFVWSWRRDRRELRIN